ncbi:MAG: TlpA disulfide reductase family protein, partial [Oscillibacter sp.]
MNNRTKTLLGAVAFAVLLGVAVFAYNTLSRTVAPPVNLDAPAEGSQAENAAPAEKIPAPDFTVLDAQGSAVSLSDLIGKPIVLNFWASWCSPCKAEMPDFNAVYEELGEDVIFVMVDAVDGQRETVDSGKQHIADNEFTFPVYYDTEQEAISAYGASSLPTTYFIDKDGYVVTG